MLGSNLVLLGLDQFALRALEGGILTHKAHTAIHLAKVLC